MFGLMRPAIKPTAWADRDTPRHARELLGQWLCVQAVDGLVRRARVTETEAYDGPEDLACHASKGRTARTAVMFGPAGTWYVYLCYGIHEMVNLVTGPEGWPAAVLIRSAEGVVGPGRVTRELGIGRRLNGTRAAAPAHDGSAMPPEAAMSLGLGKGGRAGVAAWIEADDARVPDSEVRIGPRVGVDYAGPEWAAKPWRFRWMGRWVIPTAKSSRLLPSP